MRAQKSKTPKRDKKKNHKMADAERAKERRWQKQATPQLKAALRKAEAANELCTFRPTPQALAHCAPARAWQPKQDSVVQLEGTIERTITGVLSRDVKEMLAFLAPLLLPYTGAVPVGRSTDLKGRRDRKRGASIILSQGASSSGPHADDEDTLLLNVSGTRRVWYARPSDVHDSVRQKGSPSGKGAPLFLPPQFDPSCKPARKGVQWCAKPKVLEAGDAMWIKAGWFHCVESEDQGVAVPVEIQSGSVRGEAPRVFEHMGPRHESGRSKRMVSRRAQWTSANGVRKLWGSALAEFEKSV